MLGRRLCLFAVEGFSLLCYIALGRANCLLNGTWYFTTYVCEIASTANINSTGFTAVLSGAVALYLFARLIAQSLLPPPLPSPPPPFSALS